MTSRAAGYPAVRAALLAVALGASVVVAACGGQGIAPPASTPAAGVATPAASPTATPASPVDGVLTDIDAEGLSDVRAFTVRTFEGAEVRFAMGVLENGAQFPPGHLAEHLATSSPIRVFFRAVAGELVAYRIEDVEAAP